MTGEGSARARELAAGLSVLFDSDRRLAERLNDAQSRLRRANDELWSGLHPDALGVVYDNAGPVAIGHGAGRIAGQLIAGLGNGGQLDVEAVVLEALQQTHWTIHRAFCDYQAAAEERRQLAADVGEKIRRFVDELVAVGWTEEQARNANVHELACAGAPLGVDGQSR